MDIVGTFEISSGKIIASDPCESYDPDGFDGAEFKVLNGHWTAYTETSPIDHTKPSKLMIHHESVNYNELEWLKLDNIFTVSCQTGFFDKNHYRNDNDVDVDVIEKKNDSDNDPGDKWYNMCNAVTKTNNLAKVIPFGVVTSDVNEHGDDTYNVYGAYKDYKLVALKMPFDEPDAPHDNIPQQDTIKTRYFKCVYGGLPFGRFSGTKPKQAANKAFTHIIKENGYNGPITFGVIDCTRGSKHKTYTYTGEKQHLEQPTTVTIGTGPNAKTISYNYHNKITKN